MADAAAGAPPRVWVLLGYGAGGNNQMLALARALGWPFVVKKLDYNACNRLPNPVLGASRLSLDARRSDALAPPWPDLVIAASRRAAPIARWIKARSGGQTKLVHLLHAQAPLHHFDLVVTLAQYRLPDAPNVLRNTLPLNQFQAGALAAARARWAETFAGLPRPRIAVLVGGSSSSYRFDAATAARLGREVNDQARAAGGAVLVTTSRRTGAGAAEALLAQIDAPCHGYRWRADDPANPYLGILALADRIMVTPDSASLPAEACQTGRPVHIFERRRAQPRRLGRTASALVYYGWRKPRRDFAAFHAELAERGLIDRDPPAGPPPDDLARTVSGVRALFNADARPPSAQAA